MRQHFKGERNGKLHKNVHVKLCNQPKVDFLKNFFLKFEENREKDRYM